MNALQETMTQHAVTHPAGTSATAGPSTYVEELTLTAFRCYRSASLSLDARPVVLTGSNGAGKTNCLEAVSLLAPGRGLRGAELRELIRTPAGRSGADDRAPQTVVAARVVHDGRPVRIGTAVEPTAQGFRRIVRIDGAPVPAQKLGHLVRAVWLTPTMDRLFLDGASGRRRFLDRLALSALPDHAGHVAAYERAMRDRQRLLRDGGGDAQWFAALEATMAERGVAIAAGRSHIIERLTEALMARADSAFPSAVLELAGDVERALRTSKADALAAEIRTRLADGRRRDVEAGRALYGPHRSDLVVHHGGTGRLAQSCSTGEQKALLIAIVLAHGRALKEDAGAAPLLLFDEIAAHLDETRRLALFEEIRAMDCQAWLTGTDRALFAPMGAEAQHFAVAEGRVLSVLG